MSAKKKGKKTNKKSKKEENFITDIDVEELENELLNSGDTLENVSYILENIKSEEKQADEVVKKDKESSDEEEFGSYSDESWDLDEKLEGELSLDVYDEGDNLVIEAPIAGVSLDDLDINYSQGVLTVKGERKRERNVETDQYLTSECYWGKFSRSVFLPVEIDTKKIKAYLKNGILTIILPKLDLPANVNINISKN